MALLRHREPGAFERMNKAGNIPSAQWATGRRATPAEAQRRYRTGHRSPDGRGYFDPCWDERRNGLPWRPYVYRGTGRDAYDGTCLFEEAS